MEQRLKIKVCGNREVENLKQVGNLMPDYIGFVFYPKSKRVVKSEGYSFQNIASGVKRVGVFVNASIEDIKEKTKAYNLDYIQLHGNESPEFSEKIGHIRPVFKAFQVNNDFNFTILNNYLSSTYAFVFDTASEQYGGSGKKFNWHKLEEYKKDKPFLLSGGIGPKDIDSIKGFKHSSLLGIDINSRFEISSGMKDIEKLKQFFKQFNR